MPTVEYPTNPNTDTAFVTDDGGKRTRSLKTVLVDGTIDYPKNANVKDCYVTIDGKKQRALMTADVSKDGVVEYPDGSNSTKGYVTVDGKKHRVVLTAVLAGGAPDPVIAELNVTPTTSAQTITAPEGTDGYSPVKVSAVTSSIDANIVAGNIKKDVTILGVTGSYEAPAPTGTISITSNGTHNVAGYASADVQVPTTAPDYYISKAKSGTTLINSGTMINLSGITDIGDNALYYAFYSNNFLTGALDLTNITTLSHNDSLNNTFARCRNITSVDLSNLSTISGIQPLYNTFGECSGLTAVDLSNLTTISGDYGAAGCFSTCTSLVNLNMPNLTTITATSGLAGAFRNTKPGTFVFEKLSTITGMNALQRAFGYATITSISFPALTSSSFGNQTSQFNNMVQGVSGCTVHFPSNLQSVIGSWSDVTGGFGGTNTTVLFDLPATE